MLNALFRQEGSIHLKKVASHHSSRPGSAEEPKANNSIAAAEVEDLGAGNFNSFGSEEFNDLIDSIAPMLVPPFRQVGVPANR
jgi:hypothetical protein